MTRLKDFYQDLQRDDLTDNQIIDRIKSNNIILPEWITFQDNILFDNQEGSINHWSNINLEPKK